MIRRILLVSIFCGMVAGGFAQATQLEASQRRVLIQGSETGDRFGRPLLCADLNNDGYDDVIVGGDRSNFSGGQRARLRVFRGRSDFNTADLIDLATDSPDVVIYGETGSTGLATSLAAGDVNDDGNLDLVAADYSQSPSGRTGAGAVYVLFGDADFFATTVYDFALSAWDVKILGAAAGDDTGASLLFGGGVANALACGDLTNDGIDDIAIGAHLANPPTGSDAGNVRIVRGRDPFAPGTTIDLLSQADATIYGADTFDEFGTDLVMGDVNGDLIDDLIVGNEYSSVGLFTSEGRVYVFYGRTGFPALINLGTQNPDLRITGPVTYAYFGASVALADVNDDDILDVIAGADGWDPTGDTNTSWGAAYVFFGKSTFPAAINLSSTSPDIFVRGYSEETSIGAQIAGGDFNGDGIGDFMYASRDGERAGFSSEGRTFVSFGAATLPSQYLVENDAADVIINGGTDFLQLGDHLASGDVDGDGTDEILIAAPFILSNTGRLYIFDLDPIDAVTDAWRLF